MKCFFGDNIKLGILSSVLPSSVDMQFLLAWRGKVYSNSPRTEDGMGINAYRMHGLQFHQQSFRSMGGVRAEGNHFQHAHEICSVKPNVSYNTLN